MVERGDRDLLGTKPHTTLRIQDPISPYLGNQRFPKAKPVQIPNVQGCW